MLATSWLLFPVYRTCPGNSVPFRFNQVSNSFISSSKNERFFHGDALDWIQFGKLSLHTRYKMFKEIVDIKIPGISSNFTSSARFKIPRIFAAEFYLRRIGEEFTEGDKSISNGSNWAVPRKNPCTKGGARGSGR